MCYEHRIVLVDIIDPCRDELNVIEFSSTPQIIVYNASKIAMLHEIEATEQVVVVT
jgi:hypothetical protein